MLTSNADGMLPFFNSTRFRGKFTSCPSFNTVIESKLKQSSEKCLLQINKFLRSLFPFLRLFPIASNHAFWETCNIVRTLEY